MRKEFSLENLHIVAVVVSSLLLYFLIGKKILLGFLGVSLVFHIYVRILKFSFAFVELFSRKITPVGVSGLKSDSPFQGLLLLKTLGAILRVIVASFLLFLLIKGAAVSFLSILLGLVVFLLSLMSFGYFQNFKFANNA